MYSTIRILAFQAWCWLAFRESLRPRPGLAHLLTQPLRQQAYSALVWAVIARPAWSRSNCAWSFSAAHCQQPEKSVAANLRVRLRGRSRRLMVKYRSIQIAVDIMI